ncbi:IS110 family transposase [Paracoccus litorisediminis]|uniref:IS110 family transposase n=1 Tax=Paracoccus litorisediminis TaxID=2006130 RepID=A0A844HP43_9RHOB|nr:IS110 family transposase [Paracoccus litorisediminis]MTH60889.1 IS110 family transposase [Paracoccus litorisediminis]
MSEVTMIGVDLAKRVFQIHGARADGSVAYQKKLSRSQLLEFLAQQPKCCVAMEACATAHGWGREIQKMGHQVKLIPPIYVKPFVKRQKNDANDAHAIVEAASRPTMRSVAVKTQEQQARAMVFRTRELLVGQRTQLINGLRAHLAEFGIVAPTGPAHLKRLQDALSDESLSLPQDVRELGALYLEQIQHLVTRIDGLEHRLKAASDQSDTARRLKTMPGIGPITAMAIETFAPNMEGFRRGRDFAAWLGLVPRQHSSGGKQVMGRTSKMGQRDIRRLLIISAMAVVTAATRYGKTTTKWLMAMLERKPRLLVGIALANKMARAVWAMLTRQHDYLKPEAILAA